MLGTAAFDHLRTEQQLGGRLTADATWLDSQQVMMQVNLVWGGMGIQSNILYVKALVQGSKVNADEAEAAIEGLFTQIMPSILSNMTTKDFNSQVDAYRQQLLEPPLGASEEVGHFWSHIVQGGQCMNLLDEALQFLNSERCNKELLAETWNKLVFGKLPGEDGQAPAPYRKKLTAARLVEEPQDYVDVLASHRGGFSFENCKRNAYLAAQAGIKPPTAMKSGTTICGIVVKDAVILAADTRATNGPMVADKNCEKLHYIAKNIFCAGAGTAADLQHTTEMMESQIELLRMATGTQPRVCTVVKRLSSMLFKYQGYIGCALVLGGFDVTGPHLYQIYPHGSTDKLPFTTMGSGSLAAMAIMEAEYNENLSIEDGKKLVAKAIRGGIFNDLGSGGNVDVCVITKDAGGTILRNYEKPNERKFRAQHKAFPIGTTPVLKEEIMKLVSVEEDVVMRWGCVSLPSLMPHASAVDQARKIWHKHGVAPSAMALLETEWKKAKVVPAADSKVRAELLQEGGYFPTDLNCGSQRGIADCRGHHAAIDCRCHAAHAISHEGLQEASRGPWPLVNMGAELTQVEFLLVVVLNLKARGLARRVEDDLEGLLPEELGATCARVWKDFDLIRSDDHHLNQVYCPVEEAIPQVATALRTCIEAADQQKFFLATLAADDPAEMVARAKFVLESFGPLAPNCGFQLAGAPGGLGTLTALRRAFPSQFLHYHAAGSVAAQSLQTRRGYSAFVHSKLSRILGASSALVAIDLKASSVASLLDPGPKEALRKVVSALCDDDSRGMHFQQQWEAMKQALPVISGDLHALHLPFLFAALGHSDVLLTPTVSASKKDTSPGQAQRSG
ncbi:Psmb7 [Symbiodinium natans]|uniref:proteasome endopeptidase complex n=1 Tax=Symbiodinium natans TaxID=878477 RepID=A0A812I6G0_9DINO|nr:Psmb7 [Symbiodinium natans]